MPTTPWQNSAFQPFLPGRCRHLYFGLIRERTWLQRWLSTRPLQLLGHSSYAFFLVHTGVVAVGLEKYLTRNVAPCLSSLQLVSIGIFLFFERPLSRLIGQPTGRYLAVYFP